MILLKKKQAVLYLSGVIVFYCIAICLFFLIGVFPELYFPVVLVLACIPLIDDFAWYMFIVFPYNKTKVMIMGKRKRILLRQIYKDISDMYQLMRFIAYKGVRETEEIDILYEKSLFWDKMNLRFIEEEVKLYQKARVLFKQFFDEYYLISNGHLEADYDDKESAFEKDAEMIVLGLSAIHQELYNIMPISGVDIDEDSIVNQLLGDWESGRIKIAPRPLEYPIANWAVMDNANLFSLANDYFSKMTFKGRIWGYHLFYYGPFIPNELLEESKREYANYNTETEQPILLNYNHNISYSTGFLVTNKYFYFKLSSAPFEKPRAGKILLTDLGCFDIKGWLFQRIVINKQLKLRPVNLTRDDKKAINELINQFIIELHDGIPSADIINKPLKPFTSLPIKKGTDYEAWVGGFFHTSGRPKRRW